MNYSETIQYLYSAAPMFQNIGAGAYKEGLSTTFALDRYFQSPHTRYKTIHVAGTNGKGSTSHSLAAVLQSAGYKVGLYTSPHLIDFRERIRINGEMIDECYVVDFVAKHRELLESLKPSFFEITTAMAFKYFADSKVDIAVIETGLGGRLDCTNIITPICSVITNISFDHTQFLGDTLAKIAREKAGIIKPSVPVVIGEHNVETQGVFNQVATLNASPICFAEDDPYVYDKTTHLEYDIYSTKFYTNLKFSLKGLCQEKNLNTVLHTIEVLKNNNLHIPENAIREGLSKVCELTGLKGRWQQLQERPLIICDTGHNIGGFQYIVPQLLAQKVKNLRIVFGMVGDKDISAVLAILPQNATYYFTQANIPRALNAEQLQNKAEHFGLKGKHFSTVAEAVAAAKQDAELDDLIFVGGSSFVVADLLTVNN